jgi:ComF family protein
MSILKQLVFTPKCLICNRIGIDYCLSCIEKIRPFRARDLSEIEVCFCAGEYAGWLRDSVICYKNGDARYTKLLAQVLNRTLDRFAVTQNMTLVPVPSSQLKISERGFDSMANICTHMSRESASFNLDTSNLFLRRTVTDQVGLTALQRQENLDGAFGSRRIINGTVVIVDDVITTGATMNSAARALKFAGAQRVFALALCGTPKTR